ncbi:transcription initiation factor IIB family protein [Natrarchaeobius halalkaliphilus]|uniref:Transcription initiation factor IIB n=1 Tax=Natrarchaeobius halalkaliphilus TaxID=1679091 RepID=A0A3N6LKH5_9EURY|nr:transcription initiation factor IIB family protein [Natrarchaeobius halalkaliphilus]RQG89148.1 transcription initiation factor IIB family protein [Natrarchaeobius halalkaliphilus]
MKSSTLTICSECGGRLRETGTETVCEDCGLVSGEDALDRGPEWRSFEDSETDRRRTGAPLTRSRHDRGLSTEIGYRSGSDSYRSRLTGRKRRQIARLRREHNRARISSKAERNQIYGFAEIRRMYALLSLPDVVREQSCALFKSAQSEGLFQGRSLEGFAAASVYATCRTRSIARTIDEIEDVARADEGELKVAYDALNRELGLPTGPIDPAQYLARYASKLDLERAVERRARDHVATLDGRGLIGGRNPSGVAAACLYAAARERNEWTSVTQAEVADVANVSPVTIRSTVTDVRDFRSPER